jgi:type I restriction enzyme M protein
MVKETEKGKAYMEGWELLSLASKGEQSDGSAGEMVSDFKAGKKAIKARKSIKTEVLFCERVWHFLKPGTGRVAIVLPDGILTNSSLQSVRDWLLDRFQLLAVISLPQEAFQHSGAGVKASVVFLRKRASDELPDDEEAIFMASPANIGYDATGRKTIVVSVKSESDTEKVEIHATDLFAAEVSFERVPTSGTEGEDWQERSRRVLGNTGVLGQYRKFERDPKSFFV